MIFFKLIVTCYYNLSTGQVTCLKSVNQCLFQNVVDNYNIDNKYAGKSLSDEQIASIPKWCEKAKRWAYGTRNISVLHRLLLLRVYFEGESGSVCRR